MKRIPFLLFLAIILSIFIDPPTLADTTKEERPGIDKNGTLIIREYTITETEKTRYPNVPEILRSNPSLAWSLLKGEMKEYEMTKEETKRTEKVMVWYSNGKWQTKNSVSAKKGTSWGLFIILAFSAIAIFTTSLINRWYKIEKNKLFIFYGTVVAIIVFLLARETDLTGAFLVGGLTCAVGGAIAAAGALRKMSIFWTAIVAGELAGFLAGAIIGLLISTVDNKISLLLFYIAVCAISFLLASCISHAK